jgi:Fe-S oxidoreductase
MIYVPRSKHGHLIFAPFNYFLITDESRGQMRFIDLESEDAVWGAANASELPWKSLLDSLSCIECGRCTLECPANRTGKPLDPKKIMVDIKHSLIEHSSEIIAHGGEERAPSPIIGADMITDEELFSCTTCFACVEACPVGNNQLRAIYEGRRNLVLSENRFPSGLQNAFVNMENNGNPWGVGSAGRADWAHGLNVTTMAENSEVEYLYWVGCAGSFDERNKKISKSLVKIMQRAGVKFSILGTEEKCTGDSARRAGNEYLYQMLASENIETLNRYNVKKIVTQCPHCYNTIRNEYPLFGGDYEVIHHSDLINDLISNGKLQLKKREKTLAAYHDSCYLGRYNDIYSSPRNILKNTGFELPLEASDHHENSMCCGAGGAQMWMEEKYDRVNSLRAGQLLDTGAEQIATACPFCMIMLSDGVRARDESDTISVRDIAEMVADQLED